MARKCQVTGVGPTFGRQVSWSKQRTSRLFRPNLQSKTYYVPSLGRKVKLKLSTTAIKTIDKRGIEAVIAEMRARGEKF